MDENLRKWLQIAGGFLLNAIIGAGHFFLYFLIVMPSDPFFNDYTARAILAFFMVALIVIIEYFLIRWMFTKRRYVAIGMLIGLIIPLLTTGWCSLFLTASETMFG